MFTETETAVPAAADHSRALADALRASIRSVEYACNALRAPEKCAMREDLETALAALEAYDRPAPVVIAARVHVLATGAYAVAQGDGWAGDYRLAAGKSPAASLRASADEEAERGARLLRRAARMRAVADHLERAR